MSATVRTRFAPSPTGYLHVGGARTALFNYLLARRLGGTFVLRIEDTDQARNVAGAEQKLLDDLRWLGLHWDEGPEIGGDYGPYYQSQRLELYKQHARRLLDEGRAYYAMETPEELAAMRAAAQKHGERGFRYRRPKTFPSQADAERARAEGRPVVVRFKMPERDFVVQDQILGNVEVAASELSDFVIVKGDGWPTYHFAVVVDDAAMQITHVLRGQEHLLNTANHLALQEALGLPAPNYAHLPIILTIKGAKMSKREKDKAVRAAARTAQLDDAQAMKLAGLDDAAVYAAWKRGETSLDSDALRRLADGLGVELPEIDIHDFRVSGYLPEVLVNFIALLGWSPGDDREKFTLDELCEVFTVERVGRPSAKFDREKLLAFNTAALAAADMARKLAAFRDYLSVNDASPLRGLDEATLRRLIEVNPGLRSFRDIERKCAALFVADEALSYDEAAFRKVLLKANAAGLRTLRQIVPELERLADWSPPALENFIRSFAQRRGLGLGKVAQPLRVAVSGTTISPAIFDTLALLGRQRTLNRIRRALDHAASLAGQQHV